jgi:hypothetical protein
MKITKILFKITYPIYSKEIHSFESTQDQLDSVLDPENLVNQNMGWGGELTFSKNIAHTSEEDLEDIIMETIKDLEEKFTIYNTQPSVVWIKA